MEQVQSTIGSVSRQILDNFVRKTQQDGSCFWDLQEDVEWQHHLVMEACGDRMLCPEAYSTVFKILLEIYIAENTEQAEEFLADIEPYQNPEELTAWLHSSEQNLSYLTRALRRFRPADGLQALSLSHRLFLQDVGRTLIERLGEHVGQAALCH